MPLSKALRERKSRNRLNSPASPPASRNRCVLELTDYYYENCESELFEHYLRQIDLEELEAAQRAKFIGFLITRGFDAEAAGALQRYGTEGVEGKRLAKLALEQLLSLYGSGRLRLLRPARRSVMLLLAQILQRVEISISILKTNLRILRINPNICTPADKWHLFAGAAVCGCDPA